MTNTNFELVNSGEQGQALFIEQFSVFRLLPSFKKEFLQKTMASLPTDCLVNFVPTEFENFQKPNIAMDNHQEVIKHFKIPQISYPHEWSSLMLKDAALFICDLAERLERNQLYLKDYHPWNLQFFQGKFTFVDLPSLVNKQHFIEFLKGAYSDCPELASNEDMVNAMQKIIQDTFLPYFYLPLLGYAYGKPDWIRKRLQATTLNTATSTLKWRDILPFKKYRFSYCKNTLKASVQLLRFKKWMNQKNQSSSLSSFYQKLYTEVDSVPVKNSVSGYVSYYEDKNENNSYDDIQKFNLKQKNVRQVLLDESIHSVLDVACNTGWFAKLAAHLGKSVVAFDIDEACINHLYQEVKQKKLDILPLVMSITNMTPERFSPESGKKVLLSAVARLASDCVLSLGIIHHLHLGLGYSLQEIFKRHATLSKKFSVIEFVSLSDDKVRSYPEFFPEFNKQPKQFESYTLENCIQIAKQFFDNVQILESFPDTRKLLICTHSC